METGDIQYVKGMSRKKSRETPKELVSIGSTTNLPLCWKATLFERIG